MVPPTGSSAEYVDLQLDYWIQPPARPEPSDKVPSKKDTKISLKTTFKSIQVSRLSYNGDLTNAPLTMVVVTKEKKQKSKL